MLKALKADFKIPSQLQGTCSHIIWLGVQEVDHGGSERREDDCIGGFRNNRGICGKYCLPPGEGAPDVAGLAHLEWEGD